MTTLTAFLCPLGNAVYRADSLDISGSEFRVPAYTVLVDRFQRPRRAREKRYAVVLPDCTAVEPRVIERI